MSQQNLIGKYETVVYSENGYTIVKYFKTNVIKFNEEEIILNSGGWQTKSTKDRINQTAAQFNLGIHVYQTEFHWYVQHGLKMLEFYDGMIISRK